MVRTFAGFLLACALLVGALLLKDQLTVAPALRTTAAPGQFDAVRAKARLTRILGDERPHFVDSTANDAVRARLIAELRAIGLDARVTDDFACNGSAKGRGASCGRVRNVIAETGPAAGPALLLVSHYDSTPVGPGAADDGIGMATMLEVAAQLRARPPGRRVAFLFNEGEESGLLGARAFLERDPLVRDVDTLLNFEARGVEGPAVMFETSVPNGAAVALYAAAMDRPVANSLSTAFYKLIPNSTDVAVLEEAKGWTILNFAVIGNETRYHTAGDTIAALDDRSLQHMGDQALALVMAPAAGDVRGEKAFADILGRTMIVMPVAVAVIGVFALLGLAGGIAWQRKGGLRRGAVAVVLALLGAGALTFLIQSGVAAVRPGEFWRAHPGLADLAMIATALLAAVAALRWSRQAPGTLRASFWLVVLAIGAILGFLLPGAAIYFLLPPLPALVGMALTRRAAWAEPAGGIAAGLLLYLLWAPLLAFAQTTLDRDTLAVFAPLAALLMLPFLIELRPLVARLPARPLFGALAVFTVAGWGIALAAPDYSIDRKQPFGIEYALDGGAGRAQWLVVNDGAPLPPAFGGYARGVEVPWSTRKRWAAAAPPGLARAPDIALLGARPAPGGRIVSLRIAMNGGDTFALRGPPTARLRAIRANGWTRSIGGQDREETPEANAEGDNDYTVRCQGRSCDGMRIDLLVGDAPAVWTAIGTRSGALPPAAAPLVAARPALATPQYTPDATVAYRKVRL